MVEIEPPDPREYACQSDVHPNRTLWSGAGSALIVRPHRAKVPVALPLPQIGESFGLAIEELHDIATVCAVENVTAAVTAIADDDRACTRPELLEGAGDGIDRRRGAE